MVLWIPAQGSNVCRAHQSMSGMTMQEPVKTFQMAVLIVLFAYSRYFDCLKDIGESRG